MDLPTVEVLLLALWRRRQRQAVINKVIAGGRNRALFFFFCEISFEKESWKLGVGEDLEVCNSSKEN